ncbi:MAG: hypothetical protein AVDCRST_MAG32-2611 [uncultured Nocardioides sp.]|uniref:Uncharacterized protein n=1 Tax=uncultured Nocardioides sp. TaxID=198441 RepID=A0A6J4NSM6_9ACTN|nr:MAG: hypothetical protein AVDCRST_MAG32-2611 [uncultured Nocardioides sp.]
MAGSRFDLVPSLRPRSGSRASSPVRTSSRCAVLVAVVRRLEEGGVDVWAWRMRTVITSVMTRRHALPVTDTVVLYGGTALLPVRRWCRARCSAAQT